MGDILATLASLAVGVFVITGMLTMGLSLTTGQITAPLRNPENLYQALMQTNEEKELVRGVPGESQVVSWVSEAKELPRVLTY